MFPTLRAFTGLLTLVAMFPAEAQPVIPINEDESKVPPYTLPDPLVFNDGSKVASAADWPRRRAEILEQFRAHVYGRTPGGLPKATFRVEATDPTALEGSATRKRIRVFLLGREDGPRLDVLLYLPNGVAGPVPAFLGLNFDGNHAVSTDPGVPLTRSWVHNDAKLGITNHVTNERARGDEAGRWPVKKILGRGYALATAHYCDIEADHPEGWKSGLRGAAAAAGPGHAFAPDDWAAIGAWAFGLSRALDYLESDPAVDARRVAVMGHSRLGKTALWAGAQDERFAVVISNNSGEGGAALARRWFGETVWRINTSFPHWFCGRFKDYNQNVPALPVDQHQLIALMAPRPVYVASAEADRWADPRGEFLSALGAGPVYQLLGREGLGVSEWPAANHPVGGFIGYHVRTGKHDVTDYDWDQYLAFADRHLKK
jgi:hypothetical protein